jgi:hypothetical protein
MESMALAMYREQNRMPLQGTMATPVLGGTDAASFIEGYAHHLICIVTHTAVEDIFATFPYYSLQTTQVTIKMRH